MPKLEDLIGQVFGNLKVVRKGRNFEGEADERVAWICRCLKCDREFRVVARYLKRNTGKCLTCNPAPKSIYFNDSLLVRKV